MQRNHPKYLWWNGNLTPWEQATVHVTEIGWSTVGAIFEGIRGYWNEEQGELYVFRLPEHMRRFSQSMKLVRLQQDYSNEQFCTAIVDLLRENGCQRDTYIQPLAYRGGERAKSFSSFSPDAQILITTRPNPSHLLSGKGNKMGVSSWTRISDNVMPPRIKNLSNYRNGQLANMEASFIGYDGAILLNHLGKVAEGSGSCLMLIRDGKLVTPDRASSILESITRDAIMTMAREDLGMEVEERMVERTELYIADEVFMCGTAAEITPVVAVDHYDVGNGEIGPVTRQLEQLFNDVLRGKTNKHADWRTPVGFTSLVSAD
jgi:branched-chain amino acid aminotransferase